MFYDSGAQPFASMGHMSDVGLICRPDPTYPSLDPCRLIQDHASLIQTCTVVIKTHASKSIHASPNLNPCHQIQPCAVSVHATRSGHTLFRSRPMPPVCCPVWTCAAGSSYALPWSRPVLPGSRPTSPKPGTYHPIWNCAARSSHTFP